MKSIFLIPGLGDSTTVDKTRRLVSRWERADCKVYIFESRWENNETYQDKRHRLDEFILENESDSNYVVGYSAGGPLGVHVFLNHDIEKAILISAKLKGSNTIGTKFQERAPALMGAVQSSEAAISLLTSEHLEKIYCLRPYLDEVVPLEDMIIEGAHIKRVPFVFHAASIVFALLFQTQKYLK